MKCWKRCIAMLLLLIFLVSLAPAALASENYKTAPTSSYWKTYSAKLHYYYSQLNKEEKRAFSALYDGVALGKPELWDLGFDLNSNQWQRVFYALQYDCPELMAAHYQFNEFLTDRAKLKAHKDTIKKYYKKTINAIKKIQDTKAYKGNNFNHQVALDRYMVKKCTYLLDDQIVNGQRQVVKERRAAYSVFVTKYAVCEGYAQAAQLALRYYGIPCLYVNGSIGKESHAWNMVQLGKEWYHYDSTWNDADNSRMLENFFPYFNLTDKMIKLSRTMYTTPKDYGFKVPKCTATKYEYYNQIGMYASKDKDWLDVFVDGVNKAKKKGQKYCGIRFSSKADYNDAEKTLSNSYYSWWHYPDSLFLFCTWP